MKDLIEMLDRAHKLDEEFCSVKQRITAPSSKISRYMPLKESEESTVEEVVEFATEYIFDEYYNVENDVEQDGDKLVVTVWCPGEYDDDSTERVFTLSIRKLQSLMNNPDAAKEYIDSCQSSTNYEELGDDFYDRAAKELEKHFNCSGAYLEPSTEFGQGSTFLYADDASFEGSFDFSSGEQLIRNNDFDGFLKLCIDSFNIIKN